MTRFARAKGSKASNERAPEDGTPWEVMKEQLLRAKQENEETKKREEAEKTRIENYENFLKEQKISKRKATWCDFPEAEDTTKHLNKTDVSPAKKKKKNRQNTSNVSEQLETTSNGDICDKQIKKKKKNKKTAKVKYCVDTNGTEQQENKINQVIESSEKNDIKSPPETKKQKKKKNKSKNISINQNSDSNPTNNNIDIESPDKAPVEKNNKINNIKQSKNNKKNKKLQENGEPIRRKPIDDRSFQIIINGKDVELVRFEGFPIMKKDAERLQELKTSMIKKGIPKSEVQRTIKLERRRAEKALARLKKDVCYNCRKGGHNLSDCPELKTKIPGVDGANDGVCFKCGSTEHRQFECKVQRDKEFRFATCFICKDQGHIARQCPDNPKGLYPNGGGCKLCGDVTHLKKDCPTTKDQKEETSVKLQTLNDGNIEGIVQRQSAAVPEETVRKPKKIKF
ncbi:hypothetical protein O3G_MSEX007119 [Manduca sexta]|uniref:CCHC-type domain-containing protein n=1 Tax=Manduca sexta TaxID=7130 RepID=A0A922CLG9_MANSE|nr:hypothetical protein O3G_MSEX007119 [Manduca sexta]